MSRRSLAQIQAKSPFTPVQTGFLQRKCASCSQHGVAEDTCNKCAKASASQSMGINASRLNQDLSQIPAYWGASSMLPSKLKVDQPNDPHEQEADQVAEQVMRMPEPQLQRQSEEEGIGNTAIPTQLLVQRKTFSRAGNTSVPPVVNEVLRSPGQSLDPSTSQFMGERFGHNFSQVRVHTDPCAAVSAQTVNARAYTVGQDIVFGRGHYQPSTPTGRQLIAHELTHVLQQQGTNGSPTIQRQGPAAGGSVVRSPDERQANRAERSCDIPAMCRLHNTVPEVMTRERLRTAIGRCRPDIRALWSNPCLQPEVIVPLTQPQAPRRGPGLTPVPPAAGRRPNRSSSGGFSLSELTQFQFNLGPVAFNVSLPSSLRIQLPTPLQGIRRISFTLNASGNFSFSAILDGIPHIQIAATAGINVGEQTASAGLTFTTTRTVCRVTEPAAARTRIEAAGRRLQTALNALQNPPTPAADEETPSNFDQLTTVASAISDMYSAVEGVKGPCREVPRATLRFGVQTPINPDPDASSDPARRPASSVGATLTIPF